MAQKRMVQVDTETGELIEDGFIAYVAPKRQNGFERWIAMSQEMLINVIKLQEVAKDGLTATDLRVYFALLSQLDYENLLVVNQSELAEKIGMNRHNFSKGVRKLVDKGILLKGPRIGVSRSFRLNPTYGWKGSASNHKKAIKQHLEVIKGGKKGED